MTALPGEDWLYSIKPQPGRVTAEMYQRLPEDISRAIEIVDGYVIFCEAPSPQHQLALIIEQQQRILERYHSGTVLFPRATKNPDGRMPVGSPTYRLGLYRWLADCDIRDEHGRPVHLTPHQWRHLLSA